MNYPVTLKYLLSYWHTRGTSKCQKSLQPWKMFRKGLKKSLEDLKNESTQVLQGLMRLDIPFRCCGSLQIFIGDHCPVVILLPLFQTFPNKNWRGNSSPGISKKNTLYFFSVLRFRTAICLIPVILRRRHHVFCHQGSVDYFTSKWLK